MLKTLRAFTGTQYQTIFLSNVFLLVTLVVEDHVGTIFRILRVIVNNEVDF